MIGCWAKFASSLADGWCKLRQAQHAWDQRLKDTGYIEGETVAIVFVAGEDPATLGLMPSLARSGGNVTGVNIFASQLAAKRRELLREQVPEATRVAVLVNPANPATAETTARDVASCCPRNRVASRNCFFFANRPTDSSSWAATRFSDAGKRSNHAHCARLGWEPGWHKSSNEQRASDLRRCDEAWIRPSRTPPTVIHRDQQFCRNRRYRRHLCALYHWQSTV